MSNGENMNHDDLSIEALIAEMDAEGTGDLVTDIRSAVLDLDEMRSENMRQLERGDKRLDILQKKMRRDQDRHYEEFIAGDPDMPPEVKRALKRKKSLSEHSVNAMKKGQGAVVRVRSSLSNIFRKTD